MERRPAAIVAADVFDCWRLIRGGADGALPALHAEVQKALAATHSKHS